MLHKIDKLRISNTAARDADMILSLKPKTPTYTGYYPEEINGSHVVCREEWWTGNWTNEANHRVRHRTCGPAYIIYNMEGNVTESLWYLNGVYIDNALIEKMFGKNVPIPLTQAQQVEFRLRYG